MEKLSYYYNILYENDLFMTEGNNARYQKWLSQNYPPYDKLRNAYKKTCKIITSLVVAGISISLIKDHFDFIFLHTTLGILTAIAIKEINIFKQDQFINEYYLDKTKILDKIYENENDEYSKKIKAKTSKENKTTEFLQAIDNFYNLANEYNEKYEIPIFLSDIEYKYLFNFLKKTIDKKMLYVVNNYSEYNDLFIDLLNRTYAKCLYNGKSVELNDFIGELYKMDESEEFEKELRFFENRMNIYIQSKGTKIYDITGHKKK